MAQSFLPKIACSVLLAATVSLVAAVPPVQAGQAQATQTESGKTLTAGQAAKKAKAKHGGKVLKVTAKGKGYRVKLLTDSGRVLTVMVKD
jgi:starvation-inducible outer membrane lipoprotein